MYEQVVKTPEPKKTTRLANTISQRQSSHAPTSRFVDNRPEAIQMRKLRDLAKNSPQNAKLRDLHNLAAHSVAQKKRNGKHGFGFVDNRTEVVMQSNFPGFMSGNSRSNNKINVTPKVRGILNENNMDQGKKKENLESHNFSLKPTASDSPIQRIISVDSPDGKKQYNVEGNEDEIAGEIPNGPGILATVNSFSVLTKVRTNKGDKKKVEVHRKIIDRVFQQKIEIDADMFLIAFINSVYGDLRLGSHVISLIKELDDFAGLEEDPQLLVSYYPELKQHFEDVFNKVFSATNLLELSISIAEALRLSPDHFLVLVILEDVIPSQESVFSDEPTAMAAGTPLFTDYRGLALEMNSNFGNYINDWNANGDYYNVQVSQDRGREYLLQQGANLPDNLSHDMGVLHIHIPVSHDTAKRTSTRIGIDDVATISAAHIKP